MLRTLLFAPLAGALVFASPATAQEDNRPAAYQRHGEDRDEARNAGGAQPTPRRDHSYAEAIWHVRAALNVAALRCRDANEAHTVAAYNGLLSTRRATLAAADAQTKALYRARFGGRWQHMHDLAMTKLYNFFAQPPAHGDFCQVAQQILDEVPTVPDAEFAAFAEDALPRLEAPFTGSNRRADGPSRASWQGATS